MQGGHVQTISPGSVECRAISYGPNSLAYTPASKNQGMGKWGDAGYPVKISCGSQQQCTTREKRLGADAAATLLAMMQ